MKLYVVRHGHSPSVEESGVATDAERPLSPRGKEDAGALARHMAGQGSCPQIILTSPLRRALATATELNKILKPASGIARLPALANRRHELYDSGPGKLA